MISTKYIGMDVHKESISIAVLNVAGKVVTQVGDRARARVDGAGAVADGRGVGRDASAGGTADRASRAADTASDPGRRSDSPSDGRPWWVDLPAMMKMRISTPHYLGQLKVKGSP